MKIFKWSYGRQDSGYEAFTLAYSEKLKLDAYIIKYKAGDSIPKHRDEVQEGFKHYRLNIEFWKAKEGGKFKGKTIWSLGSRIHLIRPDIHEHEVSEVTKGTRYVFSIGKLI